MDDKLAAEEARRATQHESVKAQVEGEVQSEINERAATKATPTESRRIDDVAGEKVDVGGSRPADAAEQLGDSLGAQRELPVSRRVEIESVHYLGDEGGIACGLKKPDSKEAVVVSLTHLRVEGGHRMSQEIRAYQIKRTAALVRGQ